MILFFLVRTGIALQWQRLSVSRFKTDLSAFLELGEHIGDSNVASKVYERSQFRLVPVQQVVSALSSTGFVIDEKVRLFLTKKHSRLLSSQVTEDCFNRQKRLKLKASNRRLAMAASWDILFQRRVLSEVHKYKEPVAVEPPSARLEWLPEDTFCAPLKGKDVERLSEVSSFKREPGWYSPSAERWPSRFADVALMHMAKRHGDYCMDNVWLGEFANFRYNLLLREVLPDGSRGAPRFGAKHLTGSTAFGWPATEITLPGSNAQAWEAATNATVDDTFLAIYSLEHWEARPIQWLSPAAQASMTRGGDVSQAFACRAHPTTAAWEPLHVAGAREAFWDMGLSTLQSLAKLCDVSLPSDSSAFDLCWVLVKSLLKTSDEATLQILQRRCARVDTHENESSDIFLAMDHDLGHLDKDDQEEMNKAKETHKRHTEVANKFKTAWLSKKGGLTTKKAVASEKTKLKKSKYLAYPASMPTHEEAKALLPPARCYIWRGLSDGTWQCHYPPYSRRSFSWVRHGGGAEACKACVAFLWETYLADNSMAKSECPIRGLLEPQ